MSAIPENEHFYRQYYLDAVWDVLVRTRQLQAHIDWWHSLYEWSGGGEACAPPNADGTPSFTDKCSHDQHWQRSLCRGYAQGAAAAILVVTPSLSAAMRNRLQRWHEKVCIWRSKGEWRTKNHLPMRPSLPKL
jgi:hypothetical protein